MFNLRTPILGRFAAQFELLRPRTLARTTKSVEDLVAEVRELRRALKAMALEGQRRRHLIETFGTRVEALGA